MPAQDASPPPGRRNGARRRSGKEAPGGAAEPGTAQPGTALGGAAERRPRRAPTEGERQRDPARTRARILAAAVAEFGAKGYAGARVGGIAARAGVNAQLISYYFGGKEGLYRDVLEQWRSTQAGIRDPTRPLGEVVAGYARTSLTHRDLARMMVWQALAEGATPAAQPPVTEGAVADLRRRQRAGEIPADLDPAHLLLALTAAASAPVVLPDLARQLTGSDPDSPDFVRRYADQLRLLVEYLHTRR